MDQLALNVVGKTHHRRSLNKGDAQSNDAGYNTA